MPLMTHSASLKAQHWEKTVFLAKLLLIPNKKTQKPKHTLPFFFPSFVYLFLNICFLLMVSHWLHKPGLVFLFVMVVCCNKVTKVAVVPQVEHKKKDGEERNLRYGAEQKRTNCNGGRKKERERGETMMVRINVQMFSVTAEIGKVWQQKRKSESIFY